MGKLGVVRVKTEYGTLIVMYAGDKDQKLIDKSVEIAIANRREN